MFLFPNPQQELDYIFTPTAVYPVQISGDISTLPNFTQPDTEKQILDLTPSFHSHQTQWTTPSTSFDVSARNYSSALAVQSNELGENNNHTTEPKKQFTCKYCFKELSCSSTLITHESIHSGERPFLCHICGKSFRVNLQLTRHLFTHSPEKSFECLECGKCFRHRSNLYDHKSLHTVNFQRHKCPLCPREFRLKNNLSTHFYTHVDCKPYHCSCGKSFKRSWYLNGHLRRKSSDGHVAALESSS